MKRLSISLLVALALALFTVGVVSADGGHIYGVVFIDQDGNGVWGVEPGVADVAVHFVQGKTHIILYSAWNDNDDPTGPDLYCTHLQDENFGDPVTHYKSPSGPKGCNGTFGLIGGNLDGWWDVYIDVPAGYKLTTKGSAANPFHAQAIGVGGRWTNGLEWLEFGLTPAAAGGVMPTYSGNQVLVNVGHADRWPAKGTQALTAPGISLAGPYTSEIPQ